MPQPIQPAQIDRNYVRLLMVMQRLIREEFALKIPLGKEDTVQQLLDYAERSQNPQLHEMARELHDTITEPNSPQEPAPELSANYYRGVAQPAEPSTQRAPAKGPRRRVYRGCEVVE